MRAYLELRSKIHCPEEAVRSGALLMRMDLGTVEYREASKLVDQFKDAIGDQKERIDMGLLELQIATLAQEAGRDRDKKAAMAEKFLELWKEKRIPKETAAFRIYTMTLFDFAASRRDVSTFEGVLKVVKERYGSEPAFQRFIEAKEKILEELKQE